MTKIARTFLLLMLIAPAPFAPAVAHHSYAMFDMRKTLYIHPLRNGTKGGSYVGVVLPDGSSMGEID